MISNELITLLKYKPSLRFMVKYGFPDRVIFRLHDIDEDFKSEIEVSDKDMRTPVANEIFDDIIHRLYEAMCNYKSQQRR